MVSSPTPTLPFSPQAEGLATQNDTRPILGLADDKSDLVPDIESNCRVALHDKENWGPALTVLRNTRCSMKANIGSETFKYRVDMHPDAHDGRVKFIFTPRHHGLVEIEFRVQYIGDDVSAPRSTNSLAPLQTDNVNTAFYGRPLDNSSNPREPECSATAAAEKSQENENHSCGITRKHAASPEVGTSPVKKQKV